MTMARCALVAYISIDVKVKSVDVRFADAVAGRRVCVTASLGNCAPPFSLGVTPAICEVQEEEEQEEQEEAAEEEAVEEETEPEPPPETDIQP